MSIERIKLAAEIAKLVMEGWAIHGNEKRARQTAATNDRLQAIEARLADLEAKAKRGRR